MASGPRELSDLCPLIEDPSLIEESYITSVYLIKEGGNGVRCEPKTYTDVKIVRLAGCTMAESERFFRHSPKKNHREKVEGTL